MHQNKLLFWGACSATLLAWLLSFIAFVHPVLHVIIVAVLLVGFSLLAIRSFSTAMLLFVFEIIIGSKGSLFSIPVEGIAVSIRIAFFVILMLAWLMHAWRRRALFSFARLPYYRSWALFILVLVAGAVYGFLRTHSSLVYFDANGYILYALVLPLTLVALDPMWWGRLRHIALGATTGIAVITIILSLSFSAFFPAAGIDATRITDSQRDALAAGVHGEGVLAQTTSVDAGKTYLNSTEASGIGILYRWLRDTGNGEVSALGGGLFRVFFASQLFVFLAALWLIAESASQWKRAGGFRAVYLLVLLDFTAMAISLSRSLWLAFILAVLALPFFLPRDARARLVRLFLFGAIATVLVLALFYNSIGHVVYDRVVSIVQPQTELATSTRLSLLPPIMERIAERPWYGWGFGTTVSFVAPIAGTESVQTIQVYLFEWAYLDFAVKTGLLGLGVFLWFLASVLRSAVQAWQRLRTVDLAASCAAIIFLIVVHTTTPYLNHPVGIAALLLFAFYAYATPHTEA